MPTWYPIGVTTIKKTTGGFEMAAVNSATRRSMLEWNGPSLATGGHHRRWRLQNRPQAVRAETADYTHPSATVGANVVAGRLRWIVELSAQLVVPVLMPGSDPNQLALDRRQVPKAHARNLL